ncbi:MAG: hypothetical protein A3F09_04625 [Chlamydiae bacterium RIFCSPHIGHO2_12_FULL_49_11]|nr:MAG: hypothetical protein A3F09_04625 [Chlamydiae bacterium RIFCSPHIGHO2_12_FULL_49_11]
MNHTEIQARLQKKYHLKKEISLGAHRADLLWPEKRLVIEIQISPITKEEVKDRTLCFASYGYDTLWLLHPRRYNQKFLKPEEGALRFASSYFILPTAADVHVFDQSEQFRGRLRTYRSPPLLLDLNLLEKKHGTLRCPGDRHDEPIKKPSLLSKVDRFLTRYLESRFSKTLK